MLYERLRGLGVALITPFKENKSIDYDKFDELVERLIDNDVDYIVALGTTSEAPTLNSKERDKILTKVIKIVNGRLPIVAGLGGNNTSKIAKAFRNFNHIGVDAILSVTPFYNKPSQEGLFQHYRVLNESSPLPIILYNVPSRTGINLQPETTLRIAQECKNVIGIKEAGTLEQAKYLIENRKENFLVISGDDGNALPIINAGGDGVISVLGNAFPKLFADMVHQAMKHEGNPLDMEKFEQSVNLMFMDGNPAGVKCYMHLMGLIENELRLPLVPVCDNTKNNILNDLNKLMK